MNYTTKSLMIMVIVLILGGILALIFSWMFSARGYAKLAGMCGCIPTTALGIYIMFGKYVYFR